MGQSKKIVLLGAHMSIAGGFYNALEDGVKIGCTAIQIFTKSNRQWKAKDISQEDIKKWNLTFQKSNIASVIAHASYLINLAGPDKDISKKSLNALIVELERCEMLDIKQLVLHPGSRRDLPLEKAIMQTAKLIDTALEKANSTCNIALETMAGQGSSIGSTLEEMGSLIKTITHKNRINVCVDTCHICAAGYTIKTVPSYQKFWKLFDLHIGLQYLSVLHMNDSKKPCNSKVDRHTDIGKGCIGLPAFKMLMNDPRFVHIPKILETPKTTLAEDRINMEILLDLVT